MIGQTISQYKILEKLGEGGMGVVYKAQDTKLDRFVALKFLPAHLAASEQDKARFIQEAKAASALNHPNVCTIHDIQEYEDPQGGKQMFIVMEFIDGQTLQEKKGSLTQKQAIDYGIQIADGLAAAHEKGIVHRDIKPENIMIRKDGIVQVMDFGLAKLVGVSRLTKQGATVGTLGYMSPEQVQGQETDHRSDIFSFGVLLYEMLTGRSPFNGAHESAILYEIVNVDVPPMSSIKPEIDPGLDAIVLECLAKDPDERTQSVKQVAVDLKRYRRESSRSRVSRMITALPANQSSGVFPPTELRSSERPTGNRLPIFISLSAIFFLAVLVLAFLYWRGNSNEESPVRFTIVAPDKGSFQVQPPIISPDGLKLAFVAYDSSGKSCIWTRPLATLDAIQIKGTEEATFPFWSPDSRFIAFFQNSKLKKVEATGGPTQTIADAPEGRGGTWSSAGTIVFAPNYEVGLQQVSESGGTPTQITTLDSTRKENSHRWPSFLPDGHHFIYLRRSVEDEKTSLFLGSIDSKETSLLLPSKSNAVFASPGYLLFVREQSLMAQAFDAGSGKVTGQAFPITENVGYDPNYSVGLFSASTNGVIALGVGSNSTGNRRLIWFDRSGKPLGEVGSAANQFDFSLSPDEKRVAIRRLDAQTRNQDLWLIDLLRQTESRFTFRPAIDDDPVWSPDGRTIYFDSNPDGIPNVHRKPASGVGSEELLLKTSVSCIPVDCSPDGRYLLVVNTDPRTNEDLWILPLTGEQKPFPYLQSDASEISGMFSPDGRWIAYASNESGKYEVYVQAFPTKQGKWQVSTGGGAHPVWNKNGKEIFYLAPDKKLMSVDVTSTGTSFEQGIPKPLFTTDVDSYVSINRFVVSKDGRRFLINTSVEGINAKPIMVILHWTAEIKKK